MQAKRTGPRTPPAEPDDRILREILGYLNFSGGKPDAAFQRNWNTLFAKPEPFPSDAALRDMLRGQLAQVQGSVPAFADVHQAEAVVSLVFDEALPAYRRHH